MFRSTGLAGFRKPLDVVSNRVCRGNSIPLAITIEGAPHVYANDSHSRNQAGV